MIKFLDLHKINKRFDEEFQKQFALFLSSGSYILGTQVLNFEKDFAEYCGTKYCVGVSNGLDALMLIFEAYKILGDLKEGDEVIVPANTYIATILAVVNSGLKPIFVEPNTQTFNIEPEEIIKNISNNTKAILGVHLYGQLYNVAVLEEIAKSNNLLLIEDAAQAHGAIYKDGRRSGNVSNAGAFSFYPTKNLGALGDAGAVTTNSSRLFEVISKLKNYGRVSTYETDYKGYNCRLDEIQAAFLNVKLKGLDADNLKRQEIATFYVNAIKNSKIKLPFFSEAQDHVFHQFIIEVEHREAFMAYMKANNIEVSIHYPKAPHKQKALREYKTSVLPITERIHDVVVSLPINPILTQQEITIIAEVINKY